MKATLIAFALLALPGLSLAQEKPKSAEERPADPARKPLNLKLDQPARLFVQEAPASEKTPDSLPTLGGGSTSFEKREPTRAERASPYPKDAENNRYER